MDTNTVYPGIEIPYVVAGQTLMAPGKWKGVNYTKDTILRAFKNTDWNSDLTRAYFLDHDDSKSAKWIGRVDNEKYIEETGEVVGDVSIYDINEAVKLKYGKPKFGVSAKVDGILNASTNTYTDFVFRNFSHVVEPAVKYAYINNSQADFDGEFKVSEMADWTTAYVNNLPDSAFAVIETDYKEGKINDKNARHLPVYNDKGEVDIPHLRNALARVNQIKPIGTMETKEKLISKARSFLEPLANKHLKTYITKKEESKMADEVKTETVVENAAPVEPVPAQKPEGSPDMKAVFDKLDNIAKLLENMINCQEMACKKPKEVPMSETAEVKIENSEVKPEEKTETLSEDPKLKELEEQKKTVTVEVAPVVSYNSEDLNKKDKDMLNFLKAYI